MSMSALGGGVVGCGRKPATDVLPRLPAAGCGVRRHSGHYEDRLCRSGNSGRPWMSVRLHPPALWNGGLWSSAQGTALAKEDKSSSLSGVAPHRSRCLELTSECPRLNSTPSAGGPRWPSRDAGGRSPCAAQLRADGKGAPMTGRPRSPDSFITATFTPDSRAS